MQSLFVWLCVFRCDLDEPYSLAGCGHSYCTSCLRAMLSSASHNNDFPVKCCAEGCTSCICLSDLTHLLPAVELSAAYKAAFRAFVLANHDSWGCCPTADCPQVTLSGSTHPSYAASLNSDQAADKRLGTCVGWYGCRAKDLPSNNKLLLAPPRYQAVVDITDGTCAPYSFCRCTSEVWRASNVTAA